MAKGVNKVILLGNVGRDPEVRVTGGGTTVAQLSLATAERRKDARGQWQDATEWHGLVAFGRTAEIIRDYVKKGSQLYVEGKLQTRSWDDRESGQKRYRTEIVVFEVALLGGRSGSRGDDREPGDGDEVRGRSYDYAAEHGADEDIPF